MKIFCKKILQSEQNFFLSPENPFKIARAGGYSVHLHEIESDVAEESREKGL